MKHALEFASELPLQVDSLLAQRLKTASEMIKNDRLEVLETVRQELFRIFEITESDSLAAVDLLVALDHARRKALGLE